MKELTKLAKGLGFKPKTLSTAHTFAHHNGVKPPILINDTCNLLLLHEIQAWLREKFSIHVEVSYYKEYQYSVCILNGDGNDTEGTEDLQNTNFKKHEEALEVGLQEAITKLTLWN